MKFTDSRSNEKKAGSLQQSLANERGEGSQVIADSRLESVNQQRLKGVIQNASVAQGKNMETFAAHSVQRTVGEEDELLQGKALQRQGLEEEELMQGKALQRQGPEEEELLQGKALQRQPEEEELMQGKALQRVEDEEELMQGKMELHTSQPSPDRTSSQSGTK